MIIAGATGVGLLSGCKKDDSVAAQPSYSNTVASVDQTAATTNVNSTTVNQNTAVVTYNFMVTPPPNTNLVSWTSGTLMTGNIFFNGNVLLGNAMRKENYMMSVSKSVSLIPVSASGNVTALSTLNLLFGIYYAPVFGLTLAGLYPPDANTTPTPAFTLNGNYMRNGNNIGIQIIMNQPEELMANGPNPINVPGNQQTYTAALTLNLAQLTAGINANTLANAMITNNSIIISENSNQNLFQIIQSNLQYSLQVQFAPAISNVPVTQPIAAQSSKN